MADRSVLVRLKGDISDFNRAMLAGSASARAFTKELDSSDSRMSNLVQSSLALGPALVPIGAAVVPAISGLSNQLAIAALAGGTAVLAFQGVGTTLDSLNKYQLEPSSDNLEKLNAEMSKLAPAGQEFVRFLQEIRPEMVGIRDAAQEGLFPGAQQGIAELMELLPQVERIVGGVAGGLGDLLAEAGDNLNDPRWVEFFTFLENEARPTLVDMGRALGNFAEGFANLWMAFDPVSDAFSKSFLQMSRDFALWTSNLDDTEGFEDFLSYIERTGPKVWDTLGALGNALLQIVEAAAPVGEASLPVIEALADVLASIANSPVGPVLIATAAGLSAVGRAMALMNAANSGAAGKMLTSIGGAGVGFRVAAAGAGVFALSLTDLDEKMGLSNAATFALFGSAILPGVGTALGAVAGLTMDLAAANDDMTAAIERADAAITNNKASLEDQAAALKAAQAEVKAGNKDGLTGVADFDTRIAQAQLEVLEAQLKKNTRAAQDLGFEQAGLGDSMDDASDATRRQVEASLDLIDVHNELAGILLSERGGVRAYEQAIDDATAAAKENGRATSEGTEKGRRNNAALDAQADKWNSLTSAQQTAAGGQKRAERAFVDTAVAMGYTRKEAEKLAKELLEIPNKREIQIKAETEAARRRIMALQNLIDGMNGKTVKINVEGGTPGGLLKADGGYIRGPGGPRDDKIPAMLSNGEYVINAAATAKNFSLLEQINSSGRAQRFADGGPVGGYSQLSPLSVSLVGARVAVDKDGIASFVDGRIELGLSAQSDFDSTIGRM